MVTIALQGYHFITIDVLENFKFVRAASDADLRGLSTDKVPAMIEALVMRTWPEHVGAIDNDMVIVTQDAVPKLRILAEVDGARWESPDTYKRCINYCLERRVWSETVDLVRIMATVPGAVQLNAKDLAGRHCFYYYEIYKYGEIGLRQACRFVAMLLQALNLNAKDFAINQYHLAIVQPTPFIPMQIWYESEVHQRVPV